MSGGDVRKKALRGLGTSLDLGGSLSSGSGLLGDLGSAVAGLGNDINSLLSLSSSASSSASSTPSLSSQSSSSLTSSSASSSSSPSSSALPSSTSSASSSSPLSSSTSNPPTSLPSLNPQTVVVTNTISATNSALAVVPKPQSFLQNKPLSAGVFSAIGVVVLIIAVILITTCVRRRTRDKLMRDAVDFSFDPRDVEERASNEKLTRTASRWSGSNAGHSHTAYSDQSSLTGHAAIPGVAYNHYDNGVSRGFPNTSYNVMPNPYTTYGNPVHQPVRLPSPTYGAAVTVNAVGVAGPSANGSFAQSTSRAPPPVAKGQDLNKIPAMAPLPDTFGDDDAYGGYINRAETVDHGNIPRALHVANE